MKQNGIIKLNQPYLVHGIGARRAAGESSSHGAEIIEQHKYAIGCEHYHHRH